MKKELIAKVKMFSAVLNLTSTAKKGMNRSNFKSINFTAYPDGDEVVFKYGYYCYGFSDYNICKIKDEDGMIYQAFKNCFEETISTPNIGREVSVIDGRDFALGTVILMVYDEIDTVEIEESNCSILQKEFELMSKELEDAQKVSNEFSANSC